MPGRAQRPAPILSWDQSPQKRGTNFEAHMPAILDTHPEIQDARERSLQIAHEVCDVLKVRETGANAGFWVEKFLGSVGLGRGYAWCAALVYWTLVTAGVPRSSLPKHPASVLGWYEWARDNGRLILIEDVERGDCVFWLDGAHGHIFRFVAWVSDLVKMTTLEGNTNSAGSREGDGAYRKQRFTRDVKSHAKYGAISLKGLV